jgi:hypothetical protein
MELPSIKHKLVKSLQSMAYFDFSTAIVRFCWRHAPDIPALF